MYSDLGPKELIQLSMQLHSRGACQSLHEYVRYVRELIDGEDEVTIPESHRTLAVAANHDAGLVLNERINQGASWLGKADLLFSITSGGTGTRDQARKMERFARYGERRLERGRRLHKWKQEANRDLFESGVSIIQHHPRREFYNAVASDPARMKRGAKIEDVFWRRRVDPLYFEWGEDNEGDMSATQITARRELGEVARMADPRRVARLADKFDWAESLANSPTTAQFSTMQVEVRELWLADKGYLIAWGKPNHKKRSQLAEDNPMRIIGEWRNFMGRPPHYITAATAAPWVSPLDRMIQLTNLRNFWATMLDLQAAGGIFRHWQLKDTNTGETVDRAIWSNPVPEHVLLDMSKPPPNMGPGTEWVLAPFEFFDVLPRYTQIKEEHETAGASVARLVGSNVNQNTAVGTADAIDEFARTEFWNIIEAVSETKEFLWEDTFAYVRDHHVDPIRVAGRARDPEDMKFYPTTLEVRGSDIVADDVSAQLDTRGRLAKIADYQLGRQMQNEGDIDYERRVENGWVPTVEDAEEEVAAIFVSTGEKIELEQQLQSLAMESQQLRNPTAPPTPVEPRPVVTRGNQYVDRRGTGVGQGANNVNNTGIAANGSDAMRSVA